MFQWTSIKPHFEVFGYTALWSDLPRSCSLHVVLKLSLGKLKFSIYTTRWQQKLIAEWKQGLPGSTIRAMIRARISCVFALWGVDADWLRGHLRRWELGLFKWLLLLSLLGVYFSYLANMFLLLCATCMFLLVVFEFWVLSVMTGWGHQSGGTMRIWPGADCEWLLPSSTYDFWVIWYWYWFVLPFCLFVLP